MHGTIFVELEKFVTSQLGEGAWAKLKTEAGISAARSYRPTFIYPDEELVALVGAGSRITGIPVPELLESYGEFIAPDLLAMYRGAIEPSWRTLDLIEHTEESIHTVVRVDHQGAAPPYLRAERRGPNEVAVTYTSPRKLCAVARGISRGIARHYGESIEITDVRCMHRGDEDCLLVMKTPS
jgi:predicted hydrocarbon binding protein